MAPATQSTTEAPILTAAEVARRLGISRGSVYAGARAGEIPCKRVGRRFIFPRAMLEAWLGEGRESHSRGTP